MYVSRHIWSRITRGPKSVKNHENGLYRWLSNTKSSNSRRWNLSLHVWPGWRKLIIKLEAHFLLYLCQIEQVTKQGQQETRLQWKNIPFQRLQSWEQIEGHHRTPGNAVFECPKADYCLPGVNLTLQLWWSAPPKPCGEYETSVSSWFQDLYWYRLKNWM